MGNNEEKRMDAQVLMVGPNEGQDIYVGEGPDNYVGRIVPGTDPDGSEGYYAIIPRVMSSFPGEPPFKAPEDAMGWLVAKKQERIARAQAAARQLAIDLGSSTKSRA